MKYPLTYPLAPALVDWLEECSEHWTFIEEVTESESAIGLIEKTSWAIEFSDEKYETAYLLRWK